MHSSCRQRHSTAIESHDDRHTSPVPLCEAIEDQTPERPKPRVKDDKTAQKGAREIAFRHLRNSLEPLRKAAKAALVALEDTSEITGLSKRALLEAIRTEFLDWDKYLADMGQVHDLLSAIGAETSIEMLLLVEDPLSTPAEREELHKDQGYFAFVLGTPYNENPYSAMSMAGSMWQLGWKQAREGFND